MGVEALQEPLKGFWVGAPAGVREVPSSSLCGKTAKPGPETKNNISALFGEFYLNSKQISVKGRVLVPPRII